MNANTQCNSGTSGKQAGYSLPTLADISYHEPLARAEQERLQRQVHWVYWTQCQHVTSWTRQQHTKLFWTLWESKAFKKTADHHIHPPVRETRCEVNDFPQRRDICAFNTASTNRHKYAQAFLFFSSSVITLFCRAQRQGGRLSGVRICSLCRAGAAAELKYTEPCSISHYDKETFVQWGSLELRPTSCSCPPHAHAAWACCNNNMFNINVARAIGGEDWHTEKEHRTFSLACSIIWENGGRQMVLRLKGVDFLWAWRKQRVYR